MIRAGMVGVGYWGPNLLRNLAEHPDIEVSYVCDTDATQLAKMKRRYPAVKYTQTFSDLIKDASVDLIVIATPVHTHFELGMAALRADKHVLMSKPMASSSEDCQKLIDVASRRKKLLMVDHTFVYHPAVAFLKDLVTRGELGELLYFQSSRMNLGLYQPDISVIYDLMPHDLSILNELVSEDPVEISVSAKHAARLPQPDVAYLNLNYHSDFIASLQASWLSPSKIRNTIVTGRKKMAVYDDVDVIQKIKIFDKGVETADLSDRERTYTQFIQYRQGDVYSPAIATTEALKIEVEHMVDCLQHNRIPRTDGFQGLRVVRVLEYADQLARSKSCWMSLPGNVLKAA
jgi:predicted dehydrogenase